MQAEPPDECVVVGGGVAWVVVGGGAEWVVVGGGAECVVVGGGAEWVVGAEVVVGMLLVVVVEAFLAAWCALALWCGLAGFFAVVVVVGVVAGCAVVLELEDEAPHAAATSARQVTGTATSDLVVIRILTTHDASAADCFPAARAAVAEAPPTTLRSPRRNDSGAIPCGRHSSAVGLASEP